jgi:hypothetical protein
MIDGMRPLSRAAAALLVLAAAGCEMEGSTSPPVSPATSARATATSGTATAADGTNLRACQDLTCEVAVMKGDEIPVGQIGKLKVLKVGGDSITLTTPLGPEELDLGSLLTIYDKVTIKPLDINTSRAIIQIRAGGPAGT